MLCCHCEKRYALLSLRGAICSAVIARSDSDEAIRHRTEQHRRVVDTRALLRCASNSLAAGTT
jgi:hypothetical protein